MTATPTEAAVIASAMTRSRDSDWQTRSDAAHALGRFAGHEEVEERLIEMLSDPDNISVIEAAAAALVTGSVLGLAHIAGVFMSLDEQAQAYAAVAVSDALGDSVFVRLLDVITRAEDARTKTGALHLGALIGMQSAPQWQQALAASG